MTASDTITLDLCDYYYYDDFSVDSVQLKTTEQKTNKKIAFVRKFIFRNGKYDVSGLLSSLTISVPFEKWSART